MNGFQGTGISDAPNDGFEYGRNSRSWNRYVLGFTANNNGGQSLSATWNTITNWNIVSDTSNGAFDSTTGEFICPVDGLYVCLGSCVTANTSWSTGNTFLGRIRNPSLAPSAQLGSAQNSGTFSLGGFIGCTMMLNQGDFIDFQVFPAVSSSVSTLSINFTNFSVYLLGPSGGYPNSVQQTQSLLMSEKNMTPDYVQASSPSLMTKLKSLVGLK